MGVLLLFGLFLFFVLFGDFRFFARKLLETWRNELLKLLSILYLLDFFEQVYTDVRTKRSRCLIQTGVSHLKSASLFEQ